MSLRHAFQGHVCTAGSRVAAVGSVEAQANQAGGVRASARAYDVSAAVEFRDLG